MGILEIEVSKQGEYTKYAQKILTYFIYPFYS